MYSFNDIQARCPTYNTILQYLKHSGQNNDNNITKTIYTEEIVYHVGR